MLRRLGESVNREALGFGHLSVRCRLKTGAWGEGYPQRSQGCGKAWETALDDIPGFAILTDGRKPCAEAAVRCAGFQSHEVRLVTNTG